VQTTFRNLDFEKSQLFEKRPIEQAGAGIISTWDWETALTEAGDAKGGREAVY